MVVNFGHLATYWHIKSHSPKPNIQLSLPCLLAKASITVYKVLCQTTNAHAYSPNGLTVFLFWSMYNHIHLYMNMYVYCILFSIHVYIHCINDAFLHKKTYVTNITFKPRNVGTIGFSNFQILQLCYKCKNRLFYAKIDCILCIFIHFCIK